jgi:hypothetical protein
LEKKSPALRSAPGSIYASLFSKICLFLPETTFIRQRKSDRHTGNELKKNVKPQFFNGWKKEF